VEAPKLAGRGWTRLRIAAAFLASLIVFVAAALWLGWPAPLGLVSDVAGLSGPPVNPPPSDKPSIAVLPFCNLSSDPEQAYFADGVTDDLTAMLSRSPDLLVISRSSSSRYECQPPDLKQVGRELGVRYAVEGSVRRAQDRVRITAQLIDATADVHVWSESYERDLSPANVFDIQSDIASEIANTLLDEVRDREAQLPVAKPKAWDFYMRGRYLLEKSSDAQGVLESHRLLEHAIELDPGLAPAHAMLAVNYLYRFMGSPKHDAELLDRAEAYARRSLALDPQNYFGHIGLGAVLNAQGKPTEAIQEARRAIELSPDSAAARVGLGLYQMRLGRLGEAKRLFDSVLQTDPRYHLIPFWDSLGTLHYLEGEIEQAVELWERARTMTSLVGPNRIMLTRYYELAGRHEDAQAIVQEMLSAQPEITAEMSVERLARQWNEEWIPEDLETQLRSAGLR
jgi:adenylate cyclase